MTSKEFDLLIDLLAQYCEEELDQHEAIKLNSSNGSIYIDISRVPKGSETRYNLAGSKR